MAEFKVFNQLKEYLRDKNLSLRAKGFLTMVLTDNVENALDILNYCTDSKEDIQDTLLELKINHYIRYNPEENRLEADAIPYEKREKELKELER